MIHPTAPDDGDGLSVGEEEGVDPLGEADVVSSQTPSHQTLVQQVTDVKHACKHLKEFGNHLNAKHLLVESFMSLPALFHYYRIPFTVELYERLKMIILILKGWREISAFEQLT